MNANGTITSLMSGLCMGAHDGGKTAGTNVELETCTGDNGQKWIYSV